MQQRTTTKPFTLVNIDNQFQTNPDKIQLMYLNMFPDQVSKASSVPFPQKRSRIIQQMKKKFQLEWKKIEWNKKFRDFLQSSCLLRENIFPQTDEEYLVYLRQCLPVLGMVPLNKYDQLLTLYKEALEIYPSDDALHRKMETRVLKKIMSIDPYRYFFFSTLREYFYTKVLENFVAQDRARTYKDLIDKKISVRDMYSDLISNMKSSDAIQIQSYLESLARVLISIYPRIKNWEGVLKLFDEV
uniref:Uncharacterized protein n=1 Tax=viral metagenome TaxID=1070528 RepID=A0A6C0K100_9ZZZZ